MKLLIVRHADAGDRDEFATTGRPDSERPLSAKGRNQMRSAAPRLLSIAPRPECLVTSPYARARETAEIIRQSFDGAAAIETEALEPESHPRGFTRFLRDLDVGAVTCVGHEPHLGRLVGWLCSGEDLSFVDLKKGGACLIDLEAAKKGGGVLRWLMSPKLIAASG